MDRRRFLELAAAGSCAALGDLTFLARLPPVSRVDATIDPPTVRFDGGIEPIVRLLEDTPRERVLEALGGRIRRGLGYRDTLTALLLAGVRNIQPRPVGFKFHAVLVVNSAHLASLASPPADRWLPLLWAVDQFKSSQAADISAGDWSLAPVDEAAVPPSHKARQAFVDAMDAWDEPAADAAIVGLVRTLINPSMGRTGPNVGRTFRSAELFELFARYGSRDFREIGHKAIYVANSFRALDVIGWQHAEPVLRSLAYALLDREGIRENPARADLPPDRPYRVNLDRVRTIRAGWQRGGVSAGATTDLLATLREASAVEASEKAIALLNRGVSPQSLFDAYFAAAAELMMRSPGILSLHATTFTNAVHYAWERCRDDEVRRLLVLQNAAFLPIFRGSPHGGVAIDTLTPATLESGGTAAVEEIFGEITRDRLGAARKMLAFVAANPDATPLASAARRLIFLKGTDSHDYKYSSAVLEDYARLSKPWRGRVLAAAAFYFKGTADPDNPLVQRCRAALA